VSAARQVLERLLRKGERARARGSEAAVSLVMTVASCPEYAALDSLDALESFHAVIALAERAGAVAVERRRRGGDATILQRLHLLDLDILAVHLDVRLLGDRVGEAVQQLSAARQRWPVVAGVLNAWAQGHKVRGGGPEAAADLAAAVTAVDSRQRDQREERILRRESVRLFGDSKRLERLTPWLELLITGELAAGGLSRQDVWASLGLRREPQPMLVAGHGTVRLLDGSTVLPLIRPYLGLPAGAVESIDTPAGYLLSIENLTSFHDAASHLPPHSGLLVYTAGMPSPTWRALYARILRALPVQAPVYHWGDIDEGGYRIAAALATIVNAAGKSLQPWLMSPRVLPVGLRPRLQPPSVAVAREMRRWAVRAGWPEVADELREDPVLAEQEWLDPVYPPMSDRSGGA
jgi:hypothetical protein